MAALGRRLLTAALVAAVSILSLAPSAVVPVARGALPISILPPVGVPDTLTMTHDRVAVVPPPGVLGNDLDLDGGATAVLDSQPSHGTVSLQSNGGYTYTPDSGYVGTDLFRYHATSLLLNSLSTPVTITITNRAPVAVNDSYSGKSGTPLVVAAPGVLKNDSDADGDALRAELQGGISNGSITLNANGGFHYDPGGGAFTGVTSFQYRVWDGVAYSASATVTITVAALPTPTPSPTPTLPPLPIPTPTLPPLPIPTPTLPPLPLPTPTLPPLPLPTPTLPPLPLPTARPTPTPSPSPTPTRSGLPTPIPAPTAGPIGSSPSPSSTPVPAGPGSPGPDGGTPAPTDDAFAVPPGQIDPFDNLLGGFGEFGGLEWAVPAIVLAVPGLLLIVALLAQAAIGVVWLPIVRRHLAGVGLRKRRREPVRS